MARIKPKEIIRRTDVPSRQAEVPVLAVQADMEHTRTVGGLSKTAGSVLGRVSQAVLARGAEKNREQYTQAGLQRAEEDATGQERASEDFVAQQSEAWRRGYLKADGVLRVRDWQIEATQIVAKAEPGEDIEPLLAESMAKLTQRPEFQDPKVRAALIPVAQQAAQKIRLTHLDSSMKESIKRQEESIAAIVRSEVASGALLTTEGWDRLYDMLNQEDYAWMNKRDVDAIAAGGIAEALAAGDRDPAEIMEFLANRKNEDGVSLLDTEHGDGLRKAAAAGANVIQQRLDEQRNRVLASMEFDLQDLADRGRLTDQAIVQKLANAGITAETDPKQYTSAVRYWQNQQDQTLRRWEQEAKERAKEQREREALQRNPYELTDAQVRKQLDAELSKTPPGERGKILRRAVELGVVPTYYQNILRRVDTANPEKFQEAHEFYKKLHAMSPRFAIEAAGTEMAGRYEDYRADVELAGQSPQVALRRFTAPKRERTEASHVVTQAWKDTSKQYAEVTVAGESRSRDERELHRIRQRAEQIALDVPGISGEAAIAAAVGEEDAKHTAINGRRVRNRALPNGGEEAVETLVQSIAGRLGVDKAGLSAQPQEGSGGNWIVVGEDGFPIRDPDTGGRVMFDPRAIAAQHTSWRHDRAEADVRRSQLNKSTPFGVRNAPPRFESDPKSVAYREALNAIPDIPDDFVDYLNRK